MKSPDPRERDYVKTITHKIYQRISVYRLFIRDLMKNHILDYIHDSKNYQNDNFNFQESQFGIQEIL